MIVGIVAAVAIVALSAAWLVYDHRRRDDDQPVVIFAGIGALAMGLESIEPFGASSEVLPASLLLVVSVVAFALAGSSAVRRFLGLLGTETPNDH